MELAVATANQKPSQVWPAPKPHNFRSKGENKTSSLNGRLGDESPIKEKTGQEIPAYLWRRCRHISRGRLPLPGRRVTRRHLRWGQFKRQILWDIPPPRSAPNGWFVGLKNKMRTMMYYGLCCLVQNGFVGNLSWIKLFLKETHLKWNFKKTGPFKIYRHRIKTSRCASSRWKSLIFYLHFLFPLSFFLNLIFLYIFLYVFCLKSW